MDFGLKYFLPPPTGRVIVQEYARPTINTNNAWYVLFSAGVPEKTALVIRRVSAMIFKQLLNVGEDVIADLRVSLLIHEGAPTIDATQRLTSTAYRESCRIVWPVPFVRNESFNQGEPNFQPFQGPLVVGSDNNRYALIALWTATHKTIFERAGANVDAWYILDEESMWKGNL